MSNKYFIIVAKTRKTFAEKFYFHVERFVIMRKKLVSFVLAPWGKCTMYTVCILFKRACQKLLWENVNLSVQFYWKKSLVAIFYGRTMTNMRHGTH